MLKLIYFTVLACNIASALDGPNTCIVENKVKTVVKVPAQVPQETSTFKWCARAPFRCKETKIVYVAGYKEKIEETLNTTKVCCPGFKEKRNKCVPISHPCLTPCTGTEKCDCEPGSASLKIMDSESSNAIYASSPSSSTTLILLVGIIIIVLLVTGFLILKYRREVRQLNSELAFVTYISRKESSDRFDNPLYSYQASVTDCKPSLPPSPQSPPQASCSASTKGGLFSSFIRNNHIENNSLKASQQLSEKTVLPTDFLRASAHPTSCYEDLKTSKREYNSNIYENQDNYGPRLSSSLSTTSTLAKEPVYAEIPGSELIPTESQDDLTEEPHYDTPKPLDPNNK